MAMDYFGMIGSGVNMALGAVALGHEADAFGEKQRREMEQFGKLTSEVSALGGAASGFDFSSGSLQNYLSSMTEEFKKQQDWAKTDFLSAQGIKAISLMFGGALDIGSQAMKGMSTYDPGGGIAGPRKSVLGVDPGPGGSMYDLALGGFKLSD